jgi:hypothetical protein
MAHLDHTSHFDAQFRRGDVSYLVGRHNVSWI